MVRVEDASARNKEPRALIAFQRDLTGVQICKQITQIIVNQIKIQRNPLKIISQHQQEMTNPFAHP
jgi:hypothetical protein